MAVIYHTGKTEIEELLQSLCREKDRLNSNENQIQIDYACGWAFPDEDGAYTMQMLLDKADVYMYENKQLCKKRKIKSYHFFYKRVYKYTKICGRSRY